MSDENTDEFLKNLASSDFHIKPNEVQEQLDSWKKVKINIAIIGDRGTGKSMLINALRGLFPNDPDAAKIGIKETTNVQLVFIHPDNPNFAFWDLPGSFQVDK